MAVTDTAGQRLIGTSPAVHRNETRKFASLAMGTLLE